MHFSWQCVKATKLASLSQQYTLLSPYTGFSGGAVKEEDCGIRASWYSTGTITITNLHYPGYSQINATSKPDATNACKSKKKSKKESMNSRILSKQSLKSIIATKSGSFSHQSGTDNFRSPLCSEFKYQIYANMQRLQYINETKSSDSTPRHFFLG